MSMPLYMENFGLEVFTEKDESFSGLIAHSAQNGVAITGYYGLPYFNQHYGSVQIILRTKPRDGEEGLELSGVDTHAAGRAIWTVRLSGANVNPDDADKLSRRVIVTRSDSSGGMAVVNIVNADVLPSFMEDDLITMQVLAFPEFIGYYADEDAYADSLPDRKYDKKLLLSDGCVFPSGLLKNRDPNNPDYGKDDHLDDLVLIRGTVKSARYGRFNVGEEEYRPYIVTTIDTEFGPLEIIHTPEQVDESLRENIREGAIVNMVGTLSGDVAIDAYEHGIVKDEEHNLALLRYVFSNHDPERLHLVLLDNTVYTAEYNNLQFTGADEIIKRLKHVQEQGEHFAHMATITEVDSEDGVFPEYPVGKRCVVLASGEETNYESIAFIDVDENGNIVKLRTSIDSRYHFRIDEKPKKNSILEDVKIPDSVMEPILLRARYHGIIDDSVTNEMILGDTENADMYENNVRQMMDTLPETTDKEQERAYMEKLFGYLFAKAAEMEYAETHRTASFNHLCNYSPSDCWAGEIHSNLNEKGQEALEAALELGRQFYSDLKFYSECNPDEVYEDNMLRALILTQILGRQFSRKYLE